MYKSFTLLVLLAILHLAGPVCYGTGQVFPGSKDDAKQIIALRALVLKRGAKSPEQICEAVTALAKGLRSKSRHVRKEAAQLTGVLGVLPLQNALEVAAERETDDDAKAYMRTSAIQLELLSTFYTNEKVAILLKLFDGPKSVVNHAIRNWAINELGELGSQRAVATIRQWMEQPGLHRRAVARGKLVLRKIEILSGGPFMTQMEGVINGKDDSLKYWAVSRLARLKDDVGAINLLKDGLKQAEQQKNSILYTKCWEALNKLGIKIKLNGNLMLLNE